MHDLKLEEFIYQVKTELIEAQKKHEDEQGYFKLDNVELNVAVTAKYDVSGEGNAKIPIINLLVLQLGAKVAKEKVHTLKLNFSIAPKKESIYGTTVVEHNKSGYSVVVPWGKTYFAPPNIDTLVTPFNPNLCALPTTAKDTIHWLKEQEELFMALGLNSLIPIQE